VRRFLFTCKHVVKRVRKCFRCILGKKSGGEEWSGVDQQLLSKLKEQYKRDRLKDKKTTHAQNSDST